MATTLCSPRRSQPWCVNERLHVTDVKKRFAVVLCQNGVGMTPRVRG